MYEKVVMEEIKKDPIEFLKTNKLSKEMYEKVVEYDGKLLKYLDEKDQTEKICIKAIKQKPWALKYVKE